MKVPFLFASATVLALAVASQNTLPKIVENHLVQLKDAASLTATFTVQNPGSAASSGKLTISKPNLLRWETAGGFTLSDGKMIYAYAAKTNTFTETPYSEAALVEIVGDPELWGWAAFFSKDVAKSYKSAKVGATRNIKGNNVTEVTVTVSGREAPVTLYVDSKLGIARGFSAKAGDKDVLVIAAELTIGKEPIAESQFGWQTPSGAKKYEAPKLADVSFAQVQALLNQTCMPCHDSVNRKKGQDYSNYHGILAAVTPGDPARSRLIRSVKGSRPQMPKDRAPLTEAQIAVLEGWVANGAKPE